MNIALITGVIIGIEMPKKHGQSARIMLHRGGPKNRRENATVHLVELNEVWVSEPFIDYMQGLETGMHVEVRGRIQGVIRDLPTGEVVFTQEVLATHIQRTLMSDCALESADDDRLPRTDDELDKMGG